MKPDPVAAWSNAVTGWFSPIKYYSNRGKINSMHIEVSTPGELNCWMPMYSTERISNTPKPVMWMWRSNLFT